MNPNQAKRFGTYLRRARIGAGWSQLRLADEVGVPNSTILRLERGDFLAPRPDLLSEIANALGVPMADLYAMAGYAAPNELPNLRPYLRTKFRDLPAAAAADIEAYAERLARRHGMDLRGPRPGEDEGPDEPPKKPVKKGGTR